ncbi:hypothetical protein [Emticicia sp.]|uniref:hypothetical protein n=1 Tax=Emticicia sp. TaxID=1930953 RepID=UPI003751B81A
MTDNTRLTLTDKVVAALESNNDQDWDDAFKLVKVKCHQSGLNAMRFLFQEVFPVYAGIDAEKTETCPYCSKECKGEFGLRTHVSRIHKDKFLEFKRQYL